MTQEDKDVPTLDILLESPLATVGGHVKLGGQDIRMTGLDLHIKAGKLTEVVMYMIPQKAHIVSLPPDIKMRIENWRWYEMQAIVNEAQALMAERYPMLARRQFYAPAPVDDLQSIQRISSDYYSDGKRYGLRVDWHLWPEPAVITPENIVAAFVALKDQYIELDMRALWIPHVATFHVAGHMLYHTGDNFVSKMILDLPDTGKADDRLRETEAPGA